MSIEQPNKSRWYERLYNATLNSKGTAICSLIILAGAAVRGIIVSVEGQPELVITLSTLTVVLLINKVINKLNS